MYFAAFRDCLERVWQWQHNFFNIRCIIHFASNSNYCWLYWLNRQTNKRQWKKPVWNTIDCAKTHGRTSSLIYKTVAELQSYNSLWQALLHASLTMLLEKQNNKTFIQYCINMNEKMSAQNIKRHNYITSTLHMYAWKILRIEFSLGVSSLPLDQLGWAIPCQCCALKAQTDHKVPSD